MDILLKLYFLYFKFFSENFCPIDPRNSFIFYLIIYLVDDESLTIILICIF